MPSKTIVILANSVKLRGRCIAGRQVRVSGRRIEFTGGWVRPVRPSDTSNQGALFYTDTLLQNGDSPKVLDVVRIPVTKKSVDQGQPENWEIELDKPWKKLGRLSRTRLGRLCESPDDLWVDGTGKLDRISVRSQLARRRSSSLVLIRPTNFKIDKQTRYRKILWRGTFRYLDHDYNLSITDDAFTAKWWQFEEGWHAPSIGDNCVLCISLGTPHKGHSDSEDQHYKLIASIIPLNRHDDRT